RDLLLAITNALERSDGECRPTAGEWTIAVARWRGPIPTPLVPGPSLGGGGGGIILLYLLGCLYSAGIVCPTAGGAYLVHLEVVALDDERPLGGTGITRGGPNVSVWQRLLLEDREAFAVALAEALKAVATSLGTPKPPPLIPYITCKFSNDSTLRTK